MGQRTVSGIVQFGDDSITETKSVFCLQSPGTLYEKLMKDVQPTYI